jgi:hypothetical protein
MMIKCAPSEALETDLWSGLIALTLPKVLIHTFVQ